MQLLFKDSASGLKPDTKDRSDIDDKFKWDISKIYENKEAWENDKKLLEEGIQKYASYKGKLNNDAETLLEVYKLGDELGKLSHKVFYYPYLNFDEDQRITELNARRQEVQLLMAQWSQVTAWFGPELLSLDPEEVLGWIDANKELEIYRFPIEQVFHGRDHILDEQGETLLALSARFSGSPSDAFSALSTADAEYPTVTLKDGEEVKLTYGGYRTVLSTCHDQSDRKKAFEAHYSVFEKNKNTYAAIYNAVCQRDFFKTRARKYESTLGAALHSDNIPVSVVETLIETARNGASALQKYDLLRKKVLKLEEYHLYDSSIQFAQSDKKYPYEEACQMVIESVAILGKKYQDKVREAFESRWIDVYENEGKRSGAYSARVYGVHPYMLLNYNDTLDDVFTLAHEMGHSMHTVLSNENQPYATSDYTIFVAEVASTLNEALLLEYMLKHTTDPLERALLLQHSIDELTGTFYTQAMFADYELQAHKVVEDNQPITADTLSDIYQKLLHSYHGDTITHDELYKYTWARIPHFYQSPYYVYQYATCFASSAKLISELQKGDQTALDRYMGLLKSGGNDFPMNQLKRAGVDLSNRKTVQAVVDQLHNLVDRFAVEIEKI